MISITVPPPPSANRLWRNVPGRTRPVLNHDYVMWRTDAGWRAKVQIIDNNLPTVTCRFDVEIHVPVSRRDTDNWTKPLLDLVQHVGLVSNDGNMRRVLVIPEKGRADCLIALTPLPDEPNVRKAAKLKGAPRSTKPRAAKAPAARVARFEAIRRMP